MRIVLTLFLFCVYVSIKAQQQNMTEMKKAIDLMQRMYDITFVYDSSLVTAKPQAFPSAGNSLKENLERIFGGTDIKWEIRDEYVLLFRPNNYTFSGYVCEDSGETLINVTVLDLNTLKGRLSNEHGFFSITLPEGKHKFRFSYIGYQDVVKEVEGLAAAGYKEIVLTGIHLSSYGVDFPEEKRENLLSLITCLDKIQGIERIRLGSLEPRIITEEFVSALAGLKSICPHFHLSLQSGCNATLARMNRHYTAQEYLERCVILRKHFDNPAITTDVIVGFPGETVEEFDETKRFLETVRFYEMHIFKYSKREGTRAAVMENQVPEQDKSVRSDILLTLEHKMSDEYRESFLGKETEVLLEEKVVIGGQAYMMGHTRQYVKAAIPFEEGLKNTTVKGRLTEKLSDEILLLK